MPGPFLDSFLPGGAIQQAMSGPPTLAAGPSKGGTWPSVYKFYRAEFDSIQPFDDGLVLRFPPSAIQGGRPIRSQVTMDLGGEPGIIEGGLGIGRYSISGSHGVGLNGPQVMSEDGVLAGGMAARTALVRYFETYATENKNRGQRGELLLRMLLSMYDGGPTEFQDETWWVQPESVPQDNRTAARPLEWSWSLGFLMIKRIADDEDQALDDAPLGDLAPAKIQSGLADLGTRIDKAKKTLAKSDVGGMLDKLKKLGAAGLALKNTITTDLATLQRNATTVTNVARGLSTTAVDILAATKSTIANVRGINQNNLRGIAMDARFLAGQATRAGQAVSNRGISSLGGPR